LLSHQGDGDDPKKHLWGDQVMKTLQTHAVLPEHAMRRRITRLLSALRGSIGRFAAVLFLGAFLCDANAQNLIQNPGFENNPPPSPTSGGTFGNHIPWSISPWIVGGGQQPNVVKVDGPGGYDYGTNGPESDATAPGSGIEQHYLDIADGVNKFYQSFTVPACASAPAGTTANITFGGYFSGRGNSGGTATIQLLNGTGFTGSPIATLTAVVSPGNSKTDPWIKVNGTATLVYGSTFSYVVDMPNPMNFDNAYLTIDHPCPGGGDATTVTGCLADAKVMVTCNADGTYTLTLSGVGFTGTDITLTSQTAGVTVTPPQQPWAATTTWTLTGATPGQTVTLTANATNAGGGGAQGADQCCSGVITVVMPDCPKPQVGEVIVEKKVKNNTELPASVINSLVFPIGLACTAPSNLNVSFGLNNGGTHTETNVPYTSVCTVTESVSTLPAVPKDACGRGATAVWATPVITPSSATINAPVTVFTVLNELDCVKDGVLSVTKTVSPDPRGIGLTLTFPMTVTCTSPNASYPLNVHGNTSTVPFNVAVGSHCTVTETLPALPKGCTWLTPTVSPASVTIAGGLNQELVTNGYRCTDACPPPQVMNADGICACPPPTVAGPVPGTCVCLQGATLVNGTCVPKCPPPLVANADGVCGCPPGTILRGKECVRPLVCRAPLLPNAAGTECICRSGMLLRRGKCVEPIVCREPAKLNRSGTACDCPLNMVPKGNSCVERERRLPVIVPGRNLDIGIPGLGGPRGGDQGGPRGGNQGGPGRR
jgi:hypothetical protein